MKSLTMKQLKPGVRYSLMSKDGHKIVGVLEQVPGCARIRSVELIANTSKPRVQMEYEGETDIWWDKQGPVLVRSCHVYVDDEGNRIPESNVRYVKEGT